MPDPKDNWETELEAGLPDSRLTGTERENKSFVHARQLWERVYCANCGVHGGIVTAGFSPHVFYVCAKCVHVAKAPPQGCIEIGKTSIEH